MTVEGKCVVLIYVYSNSKGVVNGNQDENRNVF
jgi:hypothetical protein